MKARALVALAMESAGRTRRAFLLSVFGIAVGTASLGFFLALSSGVRAVLLGKVFPVGQLEVAPPKSNLSTASELGGLFGLGGGGPRAPLLSDETIAKLRALPGVKAAWARARLAFPARASGGAALIGRDLHVELIAEGLDPAAVGDPAFSDAPSSGRACQSDADCAAPEYCPADTLACERPVPAVFSPFLLELYNGAIAPSHNLPKVGRLLAGRLRGFTFTVTLGQSLFGRAPSPRPPAERRVALVGVADHAAPLALTIPLGAMQRWNAAYGPPGAGAERSAVLLTLDERADMTAISTAVRRLGLEPSDGGAEKIGLLVTLFTLLFALVSAAILVVATVSIAHTFFRAVAERRRELGLLRALGATAADVRRLVLVEAALIGATGGLVGLAVARAAALAVDLVAARALPDFPFKPDSFFLFDWTWMAAAVLSAVLASMAGAWLPARAAGRVDPAAALAGT